MSVDIQGFMYRIGVPNQEEMARRLGLTQSAISAWNNGSRFPTYGICKKLLEMGMTVEELFGIEYRSENGLFLKESRAVYDASPKISDEAKKAVAEALQIALDNLKK